MQNNELTCTEDIIYREFPRLDSRQKEQIAALYPLYKEWNARINVISRKDMDKLYLHHVLHSLSIAKFITLSDKINFGKGTKVMDLGTGGGFPGIPLAIFFPEAEFLLVDSIGKKIKVVEEIAAATGLDNIKAIHSRAEDINDRFDYIVSRAVTDLSNFLPWVKGKYKKGIIYLKGGDISQGGALASELDTAFAKAGIKKDTITICDIDMWFKDAFFNQKKIIFIPNTN